MEEVLTRAITEEGAIAGTLQCMAPEQLQVLNSPSPSNVRVHRVLPWLHRGAWVYTKPVQDAKWNPE